MKATQLKDELERYGEIIAVLESGVEYELHIHDTEFMAEVGLVQTEGMNDGEYQVARFPSSTIEHFHFHKEN